jgi:glucosyl-3-phosphoglycerate synthase
MAFVIVKTFLNRMETLDRMQIRQEIYDEMIQYQMVKNRFKPEIHLLEQHERPPMMDIPEYRAKFTDTVAED